MGENPKEGEKKRSPAWWVKPFMLKVSQVAEKIAMSLNLMAPSYWYYRCDRILWSGKGIKQQLYRRSEIKMSDHRPVTSLFSVEIEAVDHRKLQRVLNYNSAAVHPHLFIDEDGDF